VLSFPCNIAPSPWRRVKQPFEFAQGFNVRQARLGDPELAADRDVQHPKRHLQNPKGLDIFQAAVRHCSAPLYQRGMHPHFTVVPRMPWITDFAKLPNMGVVLMSCTIASATTKASEIA